MNQHKWVLLEEQLRTPYAYSDRTWTCTRCGCRVHCLNKPKRRRDTRKLGVGTDCREELVRTVLQE